MKLVARNNELTICRLLNRKTHTWLKFFSPGRTSADELNSRIQVFSPN